MAFVRLGIGRESVNPFDTSTKETPMGFLDMIKGVLGGEGIQSALESTGLAEHLEAVTGEGSAVVDGLGTDIGGAADALGGIEVVPADLGMEMPDISGIVDSPLNPS